MSSLLFGNGSNIVHWNSSPTTRGTFDILTACMVTMLLCVWTAVHLNVSPPGSVWGPRLRKVRWLIFALLAPETVAYTAWYQRKQALVVMRAVNEAFVLPNPPTWRQKTRKSIEKAVIRLKKVFGNQKQEPFRQPTLEAQNYPLPDDRHPWTIVHGFYAIMGGIAFEVPENIPESKKFLTSHRREILFVGKNLVEDLASSDHNEILPDLSEEEIQSKSKANGLAKSLVCIQALWFIAQCVTRLTQRVPISLLELNTFGHAVCALLIYLLWWEKPFEVDYPTMIEGQILWDFYALRWMRDNRSPASDSYFDATTACLARDEWFQTLPHERQTKILKSMQSQPEAAIFKFEDEDSTGDCTNSMQDIGVCRDDEVGSTILTAGQTLLGTRFKAQDLRDLAERRGLESSFDHYSGSHPPCPHVRLTTEDVTRYKMAWRGLQVYRHCLIFPPGFPSEWRGRWWSYHFPSSLVHRCEDWPDTWNPLELPLGLGFTAAGFIYGGLHALAWFAHFESSTQQLLWRISACVVVGAFPVFWVLCIHFMIADPIDMFYGDIIADRMSDKHDQHTIFVWFYLIAVALVALAYMLARTYLVVECFINLSHLPAEVYDVPQWASYFPHIS